MGTRSADYTRDIREQAAAYWVVLGSATAVARKMGIPRETVRGWINRSEEFQQFADKAREAWNKDQIGRLAGIQAKLLDHIEANIGEMRGRDAATTYGILYDKMRISEGKPTSISVRNDDARLRDLAAKFEQIAGVKPPTNDNTPDDEHVPTAH